MWPLLLALSYGADAPPDGAAVGAQAGPLYRVGAAGAVYFVRADGKPAFEGRFLDAGPFSEGLAAVAVSGAGIDRSQTSNPLSTADVVWGFVDTRGTWVIAPQFEDAGEFREGFAAVGVRVEVGDRTLTRKRFVDRSGGAATGVHYFHAWPFHDGLAVVTKVDELQYYVDADGKDALGPFRRALPFAEGVACVMWADGARPAEVTGSAGFVDAAGAVVLHGFQLCDTFHDGRAWVRHASGSSAYIHRDGSPPIDVSAWRFAGRWSDGLLDVGDLDRGYGYLDTKGALAIAQTYLFALPFSEGLAGVVPPGSGQLGFIDRTGRMVIAPAWSEAEGFRDGRARVKKGGRWLLIDRDGRVLAGEQ